MPFVSNMPDDQEERNPSQGAVPATGGAPVQLSPGSGVIGAGTPAASSTATPAGGSFASLNNYLSANQGAAQPLANKITSSVGQQYNDLNAGNTSALSDIGTQVANAPGYTASNPGILSAEAANPVSFASNPGNVQQFQSLLNNTYSGPTSAESTSNYANQQNAINSAIAQGQTNTSTEAGREGLISQNEASPSASTTALNSAILSQDPNASASVENAYKPFQNLLTGLQSGAQDINKQIAKEQADATSSQQAAQNAISSQIGALNTGVNNELTTAQQKAAAQNASVANELKNIYGGVAVNNAPTTLGTYGGGTTPWANTTNYSVNNITPQTAAALGLSSDQATALQNALAQEATSKMVINNHFGAGTPTSQLDLSQFLTQRDPNAMLNAANVATPQDYDNAQAFQTLLQGMNFTAPTAIINPATASQAGTAPTNLNTFDYNTALQAAQQNAAAENQMATQEAAALEANADLAHAKSEHTGGFFGGLEQDLTHPLTTLSALNPVSWGANIQNLVKGQPVGGANVNPLQPVKPIVNATPLVNNTPVKTLAGGVANPVLALGAAKGGTIPSKKELFESLIKNLPVGAK